MVSLPRYVREPCLNGVLPGAIFHNGCGLLKVTCEDSEAPSKAGACGCVCQVIHEVRDRRQEQPAAAFLMRWTC